MTRLLLDEMLSPRLADALRRGAVDVLAIVEQADLRGLTDVQVLELAAAEGRILVTRNIRHFAMLDQTWSATGSTHPGLIYLTQRRFPSNNAFIGLAAEALLKAIESDALPSPGESHFL